MEIKELKSSSNDLVPDLEKLLRQLSTTAPSLNLEALETIVNSNATTLLIAEDKNQIFGMLTLVIFTIPSGTRAWIEDVVVDDAARGQGIGEKLNRQALLLAQLAGARTVDLTSQPAKTAANRLYKRIGFKERTTNVYRYLF